MFDCKVVCMQVLNLQRYLRFTNVTILNHIALLTAASGRTVTNYKLFSSVVPDAIDGFADKLVQDKVTKWKHVKLQRKKKVALFRTANMTSELESLDSGIDAQLERLVRQDAEYRRSWVSAALKEGRHKSVVSLLQLCCSRRQELPPDCLLEVASFLSRLGDVEGVLAVKMLAQLTNAYEYNVQGGYDHYLAEASWTSGRLHEALSLLTRVYDTHPSLHNKIRAMSRFLVSDVMSRRGEAALVLVANFAKSLAAEHEDYHFLMVLWQACFLSNWFADQMLAADLLREHSQLLDRVEASALELSFVLLKSNRTEQVYRLLEVLLLYKMKTVYSQVLRAMFEYKCDQRDVQACYNIVRCCQHLGVPLTARQQHSFILLVINEPPATARPDKVPPQFTFKF